MARSIHLVGTYPAENDAQAMHEMLDIVGEHVRTLPSGETRRPNWAIEDLQLLEGSAEVTIDRRPEDDYSDYDRMPKFRIRDQLSPERIPLTYHSYLRDNWPTFAELRAQAQRPELPYQIGLPSPAEVPVFAFGSSGRTGLLRALRSISPFRKAYQAEIAAIWSDPDIGGADKTTDLVLQIEFPVLVAMIEKAPTAVRGQIAQRLAGVVTKQIAGFPAGARIILHPCNGDYHHKAFTTPKDAAGTVALLKAILRQWPTQQILDTVHFPLASGDHPPALHAEFYRSLATLGTELPQDTRFAAGFVHEGQPLDEQRTVQGLIDESLGRTTDVAYFCGLGRVPSREVAQDMLRRSVALTT